MYVPENAKTLNFGALLVGTGKLWFDNLSFEIASSETTNSYTLDTPKNLDFEN